VATDYPGLGTPGQHPYVVGVSEGRAVLDAVRAASQIEDGLELSSRVAVWGMSQGGHAALFAAQIAPTYAPELDVVGVAPGEPATELATLLGRASGEGGKVLTAFAVHAWSRVYPKLSFEEAMRADRLARLVAGRCLIGRRGSSRPYQPPQAGRRRHPRMDGRPIRRPAHPGGLHRHLTQGG
jgi:alpha-beta hydrolase superfamily lysophospholipase